MPKTLKDDLEVVDKETSVELLSTSLGLRNELSKQFLRVALANAILFDRKHTDYGPDNVSDFGTFGVVVKANDKFRRIKHLYKANRKKAANEKLEDSYRDIANYMQIILIVELGLWR